MKIKRLFSAIIAGAFALITQASTAQTWQTVADFQYAPGQSTFNTGLAVASSGNIFGCGYGYDASGGSHGLVVASADGGNTWSAPLDDFIGGPDDGADYSAATSDPAGNVYVAGEYYDNAGLLPNHWLVRHSTDGGVTWSTADDYQDGGLVTRANAIASDAAGNIYVAGCSTAGNSQTWKIRKGVGGVNFTTVDTIPTSYYGAVAVFVHPTAGIFAAGQGPIATSINKRGQVTTTFGWLVRRSTDGGTTWSSVDTLSSSYANTFGIGADARGNIYVAGSQIITSGSGSHATQSSHWIVRKSTNGGATWSTVDDYAGGEARGFVSDANGNLFAIGSTSSGWSVRESVGGTGSWQTVDTVTNGYASAIAADRLGHVFVGGRAGNDWLVRRK